jgi:(2Fe-2S) ferredoxin
MMGQYRYHVFVCSYGKTCEKTGGVDVFQAIKRQARDAGLAGTVRVNKAGCMNQCGHGPMVVVYPEDTWYAGVDADGGRRIVDEHLVQGKVVEALRYVAPPGDNKLVDED